VKRGGDHRDAALPLAHRLTEAMGGTLTIRSRDGAGTIAEVRLHR
jgi:signal transduction histidine kinase